MLRSLVALYVLVAAAVASVLAPAEAAPERHAKRAPYGAIRWEGENPSVEVGGAWFELVAIDATPAAEIVAFCQRAWPRIWQKRFEEDLVEAMSVMGKPPGDTVTLTLRDASGAEVRREKVPMTEENRRAIWAAADARRKSDSRTTAESVRRVRRDHAAKPSAEFAFLARRVEGGFVRGAALTEEHACDDLDQLEALVEEEYAYRDLRGVDRRAAFDAVRAGVRGGTSRSAFAVQVQKLLALFGDGHSGVADASAFAGEGWAPFLVGVSGNELVAFQADRSGLLDPERPFLAGIDGVAVERWLAAAELYVARGSESWRREQAARFLRNVPQLRRELGLPAADAMRVTLRGAGARDAATLVLPVSMRRPIVGAWPRTTTRLLDGGVGYLRIQEMRDEAAFTDGLSDAMREFATTTGLVIDVRGNGGGTRHALLALLPWFLGGERATVASVAAYRLRAGDAPDAAEGYLENRFMRPAAWKGWTDAERAAIARTATSFRAAWTPPAGEFSAWHYLVVPRGAEAPTYDRSVIVLMDGGCFSATDVFLGAFAGRPRVRLVGTPSGGGSARARTSSLAHSGLSVRLASMASYRPDGRLYDGAGIEPDVRVDPAPGDFVGKGDAQLDAALRLLRDGR